MGAAIRRRIPAYFLLAPGTLWLVIFFVILVCNVGNPKHKALPFSFDGLAHEHRRKPTLVAVHTPHAVCPAALFGVSGTASSIRNPREVLRA